MLKITWKFKMKEKFNAVKFQRKVREELGKKYVSDRESSLRKLKEKYGHLKKQTTVVN